VEGFRGQTSGEQGEGVGVVVAADGHASDAGLAEAAKTAFEGADGFEKAVGLVDEVAAEEEDVDFFAEGEGDEAFPGRNGAGLVGPFGGETAGAASEVEIATEQKVHADGFSGETAAGKRIPLLEIY
jgi:hypothetical protein